MQDSILMLFQMQQIDQHLHELEQLKFDIPEQIRLLEEQENESASALQAREQQLEALQKERRQHERDLQAAQEQFKKYQGQLLHVKTNKEYDAMQHEITVTKMRAGECEDAILRLMEATDAASQTLEQTRQDAARTQEDISAARTRLLEKLQAVDDDVAIKLDERKRVLMRIDDRIAKTYDRVRRGHTVEPVVYVKKGACGGCYRVIPLQVIAEIRKMSRLIICEACGRILVIEPEP